jgi:uncharacterized protein RhaS with RHS repeats
VARAPPACYNQPGDVFPPELGRFIQQDPIGDDINSYAYAANNPVVYADPQGEFAVIVAAAVGLSAAQTALLLGGTACIVGGGAYAYTHREELAAAGQAAPDSISNFAKRHRWPGQQKRPDRTIGRDQARGGRLRLRGPEPPKEDLPYGPGSLPRYVRYSPRPFSEPPPGIGYLRLPGAWPPPPTGPLSPMPFEPTSRPDPCKERKP